MHTSSVSKKNPKEKTKALNTTFLSNKVDAKHLFFRDTETARLHLAKRNHIWVTLKQENIALPALVAAHSHKLLHKNLLPFRDWRLFSPAEHPWFCWKIFFLNSFLELVNFRARKLSSFHQVLAAESSKWILHMNWQREAQVEVM